VVKKYQLVFILKQKNKSKSIQFINKIENLVFRLTDDEIEEKYKLYEDVIKKEIRVDCYPLYYHISEFDNVLQDQLADIPPIFGK
jgi:hypothetical protein